MDWIARLSSLRVDRSSKSGGLAPHKPLLLFCILDMIDEGRLTSPVVERSLPLFLRFRDYWGVVKQRRRAAPDMRMPFHALGTDGVWQRFTAEGRESRLRETTVLVRIDDGLWAFLQDSAARRELRAALIASYFEAKEQIELCSRFDLAEPSTEAVLAVHEQAAEYRASLRRGRDGHFRTAVLVNYEWSCALTGYSLSTEAECIVEAAHIHAHAESGNDDPRNGMALTPDAHWAFDKGLWTAVPDGRGFVVEVARGRFREGDGMGRLAACDGQPLRLPKQNAARPDPRCFAWHRANRFLGRD